MYDELYKAWKREKENADLQPLSKDFYIRLMEYVRKIREESRMLDEKTTRARLLMQESENVRQMVKELMVLRHEKAINKVFAGGVVPSEGLTQEERKLVQEVAPSFESFQVLLRDILGGRLPQDKSREKPKKHVLRFLKEVPAIIGADLKTYGPFKPEDVASLPAENAKILTKQGVAAEVAVKLESK